MRLRDRGIWCEIGDAHPSEQVFIRNTNRNRRLEITKGLHALISKVIDEQRIKMSKPDLNAIASQCLKYLGYKDTDTVWPAKLRFMMQSLAEATEPLLKEIEHLKSNISPVDWRRAHEQLSEEYADLLEQRPMICKLHQRIEELQKDKERLVCSIKRFSEFVASHPDFPCAKEIAYDLRLAMQSNEQP